MAEVLKNGIYASHSVVEKGKDMLTVHYHDFYEVYFLVSGERRYVVDNKIYNLKAGDVIIVDKNELHITKNPDKDSSYDRYLLYITEETLLSLGDNSDKFLKTFCNRLISLPEEIYSRVLSTFKKLCQNYEEENVFSRQLLVNATYELCSIIYIALEQMGSKESKYHSDRNMDKVLRYIYDNFRTGVTLGDAAAQCNMNRTYFSRYFKRMTGIGFSDYVTALKIKESVLLLKNTHMSIGEIAYKSGFESQQHFCSVFKKETGVTAAEFRRTASRVK